MSAVFKVYDRWNVRIPTAPLNKWFEDIKDNCPPPLGKNKRRIKLRYITQAKTRPPSFYMFSSNPEGLPDSYLRYLTNSLRETFNLGGIPIRLNVRKTGNPYADKKKDAIRCAKWPNPKNNYKTEIKSGVFSTPFLSDYILIFNDRSDTVSQIWRHIMPGTIIHSNKPCIIYAGSG